MAPLAIERDRATERLDRFGEREALELHLAEIRPYLHVIEPERGRAPIVRRGLVVASQALQHARQRRVHPGLVRRELEGSRERRSGRLELVGAHELGAESGKGRGTVGQTREPGRNGAHRGSETEAETNGNKKSETSSKSDSRVALQDAFSCASHHSMLRYKADRRTLSFIALYFACFAWLWLRAPENLALHIALVAATCVLSFMGAVATHNSIHSPPFRSRALNRIFQVILSLTYGHPASAYVPGHNLSHHRFTQSAKDVMRTTKVRFRYNLFNILFFLPTVAPSISRGDSLYVRTMFRRNPKWFRQFLIEGVAFFGTSALLLLLDWRKFLLYWMLPHLYAAWGIVTMNYLQHDGADENSEWNHSRNFVGRLVNWWTFNNGYHTLHHMEPGLHWSLLPAEHKKRVAPHIHPALDQPSLLFYALKAYVFPGRRLRYDGKPVVLPPKVKDEAWIPAPQETPGDLGAITF